MLNGGNEIRNFILCVCENFCDTILLRFRNCNSFRFRFQLFEKLRSDSASTRQKVTVPMVPIPVLVPVPVPQHWNRYYWSVRARCVPAAMCVVRLDVARIDESPGWLVPPATRVLELGQVYPLQLWVTLPTQKLITSVSWNYFWLLSKTV